MTTPSVGDAFNQKPHDVALDIAPHIDVSDDEGVEDDVSPHTKRLFPHLGKKKHRLGLKRGLESLMNLSGSEKN